jgi:hypothetical protein
MPPTAEEYEQIIADMQATIERIRADTQARAARFAEVGMNIPVIKQREPVALQIAAFEVGMKYDTALKWAADGLIPSATKIGGLWSCDIEDLRRVATMRGLIKPSAS